jgi:hypothetical protein
MEADLRRSLGDLTSMSVEPPLALPSVPAIASPDEPPEQKCLETTQTADGMAMQAPGAPTESVAPPPTKPFSSAAASIFASGKHNTAAALVPTSAQAAASPGALQAPAPDMPSKSLDMYLNRAPSPSRARKQAWSISTKVRAGSRSPEGSPLHSPQASPCSYLPQDPQEPARADSPQQHLPPGKPPAAQPPATTAVAAPAPAPPAGLPTSEERMQILQRIYGGSLQLPFTEAFRSGLSHTRDQRGVEELMARLVFSNPKLNW